MAVNLPAHVGIIMDGNGRWAKAQGLPRLMGHKKGAEAFGRTVRHARDLGIKWLTTFAFSTENWNRPPSEVRGIMDIFKGHLKDADKYKDENVRLRFLGGREQLDSELRSLIEYVEQNSSLNDGINVNIALNYGGRNEIARAARECAKQLMNGEIALQQIDEAKLSGELYTAGQPEVDLIIRTSGEQRMSNFMLWQGAYAELVFTDVFWPAFTPDVFDLALEEFSNRQRRMGAIK